MMLHRYDHDLNGATIMIAKMIAFIGDEDGATAID
jgi:hypothetical protein